MLDLDVIRQEMAASQSQFRNFSPSPSSILTPRLALLAKASSITVGAVRNYRSGTPIDVVVGEVIATRIIKIGARPIKRRVTKAHLRIRDMERDPWRKNGMGGRTWLTDTGRHKMVIVFHDANRAGPHIDVHIGRMSVVYRVKPDLYTQLRYNRDGYLTEASRKALIDHVRSEVNNGSRVPQNLDHSVANARSTWVHGDPSAKHYGAGRTRQVISESDVDIYKAHRDGPIEMYAPVINPHRGTYLYKLYNGDSKRAPILIWGNRSSQPPVLHDRLHLKLVNPEDMDKLVDRSDMETSTAKYDGASAYVVITPKGASVWSPRQSVKTGEQIEYTHKISGMAQTTSPVTIIAMGEVLFREKTRWPWQQGRYLSAAEIGGILNSNNVAPSDLESEIRLYRVDRVGRIKTVDEEFWTNRSLQEEVASLNPDKLKVVSLMDPEAAKAAGFEGVVTVPSSKSVNDGFKMKWWSDPHDWRIDAVEFREGGKGGLAGVIRCTSLESGRTFNLGPGQVGNHDLVTKMMHNPDDYIGVVIKVNSRHGHEGRAAKLVGFHDDKGFAPV